MSMQPDQRLVPVTPEQISFQGFLSEAASKLKTEGHYSTDLTSSQVKGLVADLVASTVHGLSMGKWAGVANVASSVIRQLNVGIANQELSVSGGVDAHIKVGKFDLHPDVRGTVVVGNVPGDAGRLQTVRVETTPAKLEFSGRARKIAGAIGTLLGLPIPQGFPLQDKLHDFIAKRGVNGLVQSSLNGHMLLNEAYIGKLGLQVTPDNRLHVDMVAGTPNLRRLKGLKVPQLRLPGAR